MKDHWSVGWFADGQHGQGGRLCADNGSAAFRCDGGGLKQELVHVFDAVGFRAGVGGGEMLAHQGEQAIARLDGDGGVSGGGGGEGGIALRIGGCWQLRWCCSWCRDQAVNDVVFCEMEC